MPNWILIAATSFSTLLLGGLALFVWRQLAPRENRAETRLRHLYSSEDEQFLRTMSALFTAPSHGGNRVTALFNGDEIFPAMLDAIASAERTITFETFIYWSGDMGRRFSEALSERARAGVAVHVLLDWFGSLPLDQTVIESMRQAGAHVERYHEPRFARPHHTNHRTHRKLLVIDGRMGFAGGVGIADEWTGNAQDRHHWRDSHFRVEGPGVAGLQRAFMDNWMKATGEVLHTEAYFPHLEPAGDAVCQVFQSSPQGGSDSVRLMYLLALNAARRSIRLSTAYLVPDRHCIAALHAAHRRGVSVEIIVPGEHNDSDLVRLVSRARYGVLLRGGVRIFEYQPTMYHTKMMMVDDVWLSVGSANFDNRSFRLNDEVNLNVYDRDLARQQSEWFERDKQRSRPVDLKEWDQRPLAGKIKEHAALLVRSQI